MARGVAFQLVEALGVLERQKVAEEVKGLDQPARATLRKYGVRFGAYHIYLPILLKPAPRALATQLWALKHESPDAKGVGELLHLAASGRTSIPVDKETPKPLYRTAGYRVCGERAVRVDILERLADLIRPALSWREGVARRRSRTASFDGRGFTVTGAMTSLTGASGEDFASILRSLGYRMDRRPKPPEPAKPAEPRRQPRPRRQSSGGRSRRRRRCADRRGRRDEPETLPAIEAPADRAAATESPPAELAAERAAAGRNPRRGAPEVLPSGTSRSRCVRRTCRAGGRLRSSGSPTAAALPAEPEMIEVWRPAGRSEKRPHTPRRPRRPAAGAAAPAAARPPRPKVRCRDADCRRRAGRIRRTAQADRAAVAAASARRDRQQRQERHERQQRMERQRPARRAPRRRGRPRGDRAAPRQGRPRRTRRARAVLRQAAWRRLGAPRQAAGSQFAVRQARRAQAAARAEQQRIDLSCALGSPTHR